MDASEPAARRPQLLAVEGGDVTRVTLRLAGTVGVGEAAVTAGERGPAGARAALEALDAVTPAAARFRLDWCGQVEPGSGLPAIMVVLVTLEVAGVAMRYAGAVTVSGDPETVAAQAALDALNRRLEILGAS